MSEPSNNLDDKKSWHATNFPSEDDCLPRPVLDSVASRMEFALKLERQLPPDKIDIIRSTVREYKEKAAECQKEYDKVNDEAERLKDTLKRQKETFEHESQTERIKAENDLSSLHQKCEEIQKERDACSDRMKKVSKKLDSLENEYAKAEQQSMSEEEKKNWALANLAAIEGQASIMKENIVELQVKHEREKEKMFKEERSRSKEISSLQAEIDSIKFILEALKNEREQTENDAEIVRLAQEETCEFIRSAFETNKSLAKGGTIRNPLNFLPPPGVPPRNLAITQPEDQDDFVARRNRNDENGIRTRIELRKFCTEVDREELYNDTEDFKFGGLLRCSGDYDYGYSHQSRRQHPPRQPEFSQKRNELMKGRPARIKPSSTRMYSFANNPLKENLIEKARLQKVISAKGHISAVSDYLLEEQKKISEQYEELCNVRERGDIRKLREMGSVLQAQTVALEHLDLAVKDLELIEKRTPTVQDPNAQRRREAALNVLRNPI